MGERALTARLRPTGETGIVGASRRPAVLVVWGVVALGLAWVLRGVDFRELAAFLVRLNWAWATLAVLADIAAYVCQGRRWRYVLPAGNRLTVLAATRAVYAGLFANEILPLRVGELVRAYLVARQMKLGVADILPSIFIERFLDLVWTAIAVGVAVMFVPLPNDLSAAGMGVGALSLAAAGVFLWIVLRTETGPEPASRGAAGLVARTVGLLAGTRERIRAVGRSQAFAASAFWSLFVLLFQILAFWFAAKGCGLSISFWVGAVVFLVIHLGTALPNTPANVGSYQFFCVVGLTLFGVGKTQAAAFSMIVFMLLTVPLWALGAWAVAASGNTLSDLRREIARAS